MHADARQKNPSCFFLNKYSLKKSVLVCLFVGHGVLCGTHYAAILLFMFELNRM